MPSGLSPRLVTAAVLRSRLALLLLAHYNRMVDAERRTEALEARALWKHIDAMTSFLDRHGRTTHIAAISIPCVVDDDREGILRPVNAAGMDHWCVAPPNLTPERKRLLHPDGALYSAYAEALASRLEIEGFLKKRDPSAPIRSGPPSKI
ncbi:MAG: hypothetical protein M5R36_03810 [Deltaproteobacteria bacterium]|nr:hypothetical protein [Deltaproteobacteria bacterium]